jgi:hypothetical protein
LLDVAGDGVVHLGRPRVDQDVSLRRGDQIGRDVPRADVVDVADDPERRHRLAVGHAELRIPLAREEARSLGDDDGRQREQQRHGWQQRAMDRSWFRVGAMTLHWIV